MDLHLLLEKAIKIAETAHAGQYDKGGIPYIQHVMYVVNQLEKIEEKIVGSLHDVVEDTHWTLDDLRNEGFPEYIVDAVDAITKRDNETRNEYIYRIYLNGLAINPKLKDIENNSDLSRIPNYNNREPELVKQDKRRLKRYQKDTDILSTDKYTFDKTEKQWMLKR